MENHYVRTTSHPSEKRTEGYMDTNYIHGAYPEGVGCCFSFSGTVSPIRLGIECKVFIKLSPPSITVSSNRRREPGGDMDRSLETTHGIYNVVAR